MIQYYIRLDGLGHRNTRINTLYTLAFPYLRHTNTYSIFIGMTGFSNYDYTTAQHTYETDCIANRVDEIIKVKRWEI